MSILVITNESDVTSDAVIRGLADKGASVFRLNTERICEQFDFTVDLSLSGMQKGRFASLFYQIELEEIQAIYYRRPEFPKLDELKPEYRDFVSQEIRCFLRWLWFSLSADVFWINKPHRIRDAESKIDQLRLAARQGLRVPRTIITNQPNSVHSFYEECEGRVVTKPLGPGYIASDNQRLNIYTNRLLGHHLDHIDGVRFLPCLFQEHVEKSYEIRITIVGNKVFAAEIHSQQSERTKDDWRRYDLPNTPHKIHELPEAIAGPCLAMMRKYDLFFGAFDFIVDKAGEYVFLELNPNGQWLWIEGLTNLPILDSIVDSLLCPPKD